MFGKHKCSVFNAYAACDECRHLVQIGSRKHVLETREYAQVGRDWEGAADLCIRCAPAYDRKHVVVDKQGNETFHYYMDIQRYGVEVDVNGNEIKQEKK